MNQSIFKLLILITDNEEKEETEGP